MRKYLLSFLMASVAGFVSAQDNMEAFHHLSVGAEVGLHGFGIEVAMPVQKHLVVKAGYNWAPSGDLVNTDIKLDTKDLHDAQVQYDPVMHFEHMLGEETTITTGVHLGLSNIKAMLDWYPFASGRFYVAGGLYYTPSSKKDDPFIRLSGKTTENDWAALKELRQKTGDDSYEMKLTIGDEDYPVMEVDGCGYVEAEYKLDPLKYYLGVGLGRCVPNKLVGLQVEMGAMIYHNSLLYCQDKKVGSITDAADSFGNDTKEILEYVDKYPIYPQITLRLSFRMF